ncbi:nuclear transport factor 2-like [Zingiber officinale]|uniref:nuclear transport factor 2-like n=1 Tax=Zingiber officinale TaxID=94328 RepID=UPI001C4C7B9C|nr:nuclear transport factor 2-like [Zingiber officinale]
MAVRPSSAAESLRYAQIVGETFVDQYYNYVRNSPELVHRFYQERSRLGRPDGHGNVTSVTTIDGIRENILSMDFSIEEIKGVNCQDSLDGGVMVFVTGFLTREEDNSKREFNQSFFLAPHETGFYVLNDMLMYGAESHPDSSFNDSRSSPQPENASQDKDSHRTDETSDEMNRDSGPLNNGESSAWKEEEPGNVIDVTADGFPPLLVKSETKSDHEENLKKSYASVVKVMKDTASESAPAWCPASGHPASRGPISGSIGSERKKFQKAQYDAYSLYLNYLPFDVTPAQVEEEFKRFGPIKPGGIQIKRYKFQNSCFGFVEFKFSDAVQRAIEASPITMADHIVYVHRKKILHSGVNNKGKFASSRGAHQNYEKREKGERW